MPDGTSKPQFKGDDEARKANRLYWDTEESVNGLAERMELSKGRLYDLITPLAVEAVCPECGEPLVFLNRTARDRGNVTCEACGFEAHRDEVEGDTTPPPHPATRTARGGGLQPDGTLIGVALLGVAIGLALGRWLRN